MEQILVATARPENIEKHSDKKIDFSEDAKCKPSELVPLMYVTLQFKTDSFSSIHEDEKEVVTKLFNDQIREDFAYYNQTRDLEFGTQRTAILQDIVDKMLDDTDKKARIVIMRKGREKEAFVTPDGTIFLSQSLLNVCDSLDEIGAVLAHEVNHIVHETSVSSENVELIIEKLALGSLHEIVADVETMHFMEKADLNTRAFETIIQKISPQSRDFFHQTGLTRASINTGVHYARDSKTANNPYKSIPKFFQNEEIVSTNRELLQRINFDMQGENIQSFAEDLEKLHGRDILNTVERFNNSQIVTDHSLDSGAYPQAEEIAQVIFSEIGRRLKNLSVSQQQQGLFILGLKENTHSAKLIQAFSIKPNFTFDDLKAISESLPEYIQKGDHSFLFQKVFGMTICQGYQSCSSVSDLSKYLVENHFFRRFNENDFSVAESIHLLTNLYAPNQKISREKNISAYQFGTYHEVIRDDLESHKNYLKQLIFQFSQKYFYLSVTQIDTQFQFDVVQYIQKMQSMGFWFTHNDIESFQSIYSHLSEDQPYAKKYYELLAQAGKFSIHKEKPRELSYQEILATELRNKFCNPQSDNYADIGTYTDAINALRIQSYVEKIPLDQLYQDVVQIIDESHIQTKDKPSLILKMTNEPKQWTTTDSEIVKYVLKLQALTMLDPYTPERYYQEVTNLMNRHVPDISQVPFFDMVEFLGPLLKESTSYGSPGSSSLFLDYLSSWKYANTAIAKVKNLGYISELPHVKYLLTNASEMVLPTTLGEFEQLLYSIQNYSFLNYGGDGLFERNITSIILGDVLRKRLIALLREGVTVDEYPSLKKIIQKSLPRNSEIGRYIQRLNVLYLQSKNITLHEKISFLRAEFESVGFEGLETVAESIETYSDWCLFETAMKHHIQSYLTNPTQMSTVIPFLDYIASHGSDRFKLIFETATENPEVSTRLNTSLVQKWAGDYVSSQDRENAFYFYNPQTEQIEYSTYAGLTMTPEDIVSRLKQLPQTIRYYLCAKLLTDQYGAFTHPDKREQLTQIVYQALGLKPGFVADVLNSTIQEGDPKLLSIFTSKILGPLLFRGLDSQAADFESILHSNHSLLHTVKTAKNLQRIVKRFGWDIFIPKEYAEGNDASVIEKVKSLAHDKEVVFELLTQVLPAQEDTIHAQSTQTEIEPALESIISAIEFSSALGRRGLQFFRQLQQHSPELEHRLSRSFDGQKGMNKLLLWYNLRLHADRDPQLKTFIEQRLVRIKEYAGGGSLFTTFFVDTTDGNTHDIVPSVIRMLNPSSQSLLEENYKAAQRVIAAHRKKYSKKWKSQIDILEMVLDLSHGLCLREINDLTFDIDDAHFRSVISNPAVYEQGVSFEAPVIDFYSPKVRFEREAPGITLNKLLSDMSHSEKEKRHVVISMAKFLKKLVLGRANNMFVADDKSQYHLAISDPHPGNLLVHSDSKSQVFSVIDRDMYLHLQDADIHLATVLMQEHTVPELLSGFITYVCEKNNIKNVFEKATVSAQIGTAFAKAAVQNGNNTFTLFQALLSSIPLQYALKVQDLRFLSAITSWDILLKKYGSKWENV